MKAKPMRKPLRDVSNRTYSNTNASSKSTTTAKKEMEKNDRSRVEEKDQDLDRLLLLQSDLSALVHQVDELVVQAFKVKETGKQGRKEIESFTNFLSEMLSSLKPWILTFQKVFSDPSLDYESQLRGTSKNNDVSSVKEFENNDAVESPDQTKMDSLISPSPLVSWRADCTIERGRQLFLLTPLPISKTLSCKPQVSSTSVFNRMTSCQNHSISSVFTTCGDTNDDLLECLGIKQTPSKSTDSYLTKVENNAQHSLASPSMFQAKTCSMVVVSTPCMKMSPPKSCVVLEPISESCHKGKDKLRKSTPFPVGNRYYSGAETSESSGSDASEGLALKYPEILGIQRAQKTGFRKKEVETSPDWFLSPPKTCVLLEPPDENSLDIAAADTQMPMNDYITNQQMKLSVLEENVVKVCHQTNRSVNNQEPVGISLTLAERTPMWKEKESVIKTGKRPGENTLKKELWTRFEAASTKTIRVNSSIPEKSNQKGFLDLLDEVSCDEESEMRDDLR